MGFGGFMREVVIDLETTKFAANESYSARLVALGVYVLNGGKPECWVVEHSEVRDSERLDFYRQMFNTQELLVIGHNLPGDIGWLQKLGFTFARCKFFDTMVALRHINENESRYDLKSWATYMGYPAYWRAFKAWLAHSDTHLMPLKDLIPYNEMDLKVTAALYRQVRAKPLGPAFDLEMEILPLVAAMKMRGFRIDPQKIEAHVTELAGSIAAIEQQFKAEYGEINLNSPVQVARLLYDRLKLRKIAGRSTAEATISQLDHPVAKMILKRRQAVKLIGTYLKPFYGQAAPEAHGDFMIHGTESGRFTCRSPNLQNIPERLRDVFVSRLGMFLWVDLDQLEFKLISDVANEERMIRLINAGRDVHSIMAKRLYGKVTDELRKKVKTGNYAVAYGAGVGRLMEHGMTYNEAKEMIHRLRGDLRRIAEFVQLTHLEVQEKQYVQSVSGRKRRFPYDWALAGQDKMFACQREGLNFKIQSFGHDLLLCFWADFESELNAAGVEHYYVNEVHDELVLEIRPDQVEKATACAQKALDNIPCSCYKRFGYKLKVSITGSVHHGPVWK